MENVFTLQVSVPFRGLSVLRVLVYDEYKAAQPWFPSPSGD